MGCSNSKPAAQEMKPIRKKTNTAPGVPKENNSPTAPPKEEKKPKDADECSTSSSSSSSLAPVPTSYKEQTPSQCHVPIHNLHKFKVVMHFKTKKKFPKKESVGLKIDFAEGNPNYINTKCIAESNGLLKSQRNRMRKIFGPNILSKDGPNSLSENVSIVRVEGNDVELMHRDLVPGDIVKLGKGGAPACDCRVLMSDGITVETSVLTGEPDPQLVTADDGPPNVPAIRQRNVVLWGHQILSGTGWGMVYAIARQTNLGDMYSLTVVQW